MWTWSSRFTLSTLLVTASTAPAWAVGSVSLASPANGGYVSSTPTLRWNAATSATSYTLTITPSSGNPIVKTALNTTSYTLTSDEALSTSGAPYTWRVTAYDAANASADSNTWSFFVDMTPPDPFAITFPAAGAWTNSSKARVDWAAATDMGAGIAAYHVYVDGVLCRDETGTYNSSTLGSCKPAEGPHFWTVSAEDKVGNITWCSECTSGTGGREFRVDDTGPADPAATGGTFMLSSYATPSGGGGMLDTGITITAGQPLAISATGTWCVVSCSTSVGCLSVNGTSSSGMAVPAECNAYSLIASIGSKYYCIGTGSTFTPTTSGKLLLGMNSNNGSCSTPTVTVAVTGGRSFALIEPEDGVALPDRSPLFSWNTATDSGAGGVSYTAYIDVPGNTPNSQLVTVTDTSITFPEALTDGRYKWHVTAKDAADNRTDSALRWVTIDTVRPEEFRLSSPADGACTSVPTPGFSWDLAHDATTSVATHKLYIDNVVMLTNTGTYYASGTPPVALAQGKHSWYVVEVDRAGNWRQSSDTRDLWVDYTPPSPPTLTGPSSGATLVDPPVFTWTAATDNVELKSYEIYVDEALFGTVDANTTSYLSRTDLPLGNHTWTVRSIDRCGQYGQATAGSFTMLACEPDGAQHPCPGNDVAPCKPGTRTCTTAGTWSACGGAQAPTNEVCNGIDDNCDGIIDNSTLVEIQNQCGGACTMSQPYLWTACDGPDADSCKEGHIVCDGLNATQCVETTPNNVEICNGVDDDCNGVIDDSCTQGGTGGATSTGGTSSTGGGTGGSTLTAGGAGGIAPTTGGAGASIPSGGNSAANLGGNSGLTGSDPGGAGAMSSGGQNPALGGMFAASGASGVVTNTGGIGSGTTGSAPGIGGLAGVGGMSSGGLGGSSVIATGEAGNAGAASAGQSNASASGGNTSAGVDGGTEAQGGATANLTAGTSPSVQSTSTNVDAGVDGGGESNDGGCGCRTVSTNKNRTHWTLLIGLTLLSFARRHNQKKKNPKCACRGLRGQVP